MNGEHQAGHWKQSTAEASRSNELGSIYRVLTAVGYDGTRRNFYSTVTTVLAMSREATTSLWEHAPSCLHFCPDSVQDIQGYESLLHVHLGG